MSTPFCRVDSCGALRDHVAHHEPYGQKRTWQSASVNGGAISMTSHAFQAEPASPEAPEEEARAYTERIAIAMAAVQVADEDQLAPTLTALLLPIIERARRAEEERDRLKAHLRERHKCPVGEEGEDPD